MPSVQVNGVDIYYRDEGRGPAVILGHSSTGSGGQWRRLIDDNKNRYRLLAPDFHGYGRSGDLPDGANLFDAEAGVIEAMMALTEGPVHLVGHSYGGSIVARTSLRDPGRVRSLTVVEPTLFHLLSTAGETEADKEIRGVAQRVIDHVAAGDTEEAARGFIGYWVGPGAFDAMDETIRQGIESSMDKLCSEWIHCFKDGQPTLEDFGGLGMPILILCATETTLAARRTAALLREALPGHSYAAIERAGHMSPLTHPQKVNPIITAHLEKYG